MEIIDQLDLKDRPIKMGVLALAALGALQLLKMALGVKSAIFRYCLLPRLNLADRYGKGSWAVITGYNNQGIVVDPCLLQCRHNLPD